MLPPLLLLLQFYMNSTKRSKFFDFLVELYFAFILPRNFHEKPYGIHLFLSFIN